jgi:lipopolysaccharide transport system ATP-binding protein
MGKPSVTVEGLSKKFGLSLKSALKYGLTDSFRRLTGRGKNENLRLGEFWALKDVNFTLEPGDALGIMGVNGSGKTTLLRILNGSYTPDAGSVVLRGRIGALIAAGAGFSPMLTGRENVFISGTLLGMSPAEIRRKFDEIVAFADLGEFIDMPVRNYSSGMSVRLGFAVAVLGTPEILLVDEVLAVGDINFQKRCYERIFKLRQEGTAIILVSHSIGAIWAVCTSGLFLDHGVSTGKISVEEACNSYNLRNIRDAAEYGEKHELTSENPVSPWDPDSEAFINKCEACNAGSGEPQAEFAFGEPILLKMYIELRERIKDVIFRYSLDSVHYKYFTTIDNSFCGGMGLSDYGPGRFVVHTLLPKQSYRPGWYSVNTAICRKNIGTHLYVIQNAARFVIKPPTDIFLYDPDSPAVLYQEAHYDIVQE